VVKYRVVDCRGGETDGQEMMVDSASSPEDAARKAIDEVLVRSGRRSDLRVRVYYQYPDQALSMVRLYAKAIDRD
jgi:hypothetical protein|tara:strand:- start:54731 stop:54955 length:225 start_codon:yes stop_codon:yes gene_type:complete